MAGEPESRAEGLAVGIIGSCGNDRQPRPEHRRETEEANAPLKIGQYFQKIYAPCRSRDPSLDE